MSEASVVSVEDAIEERFTRRMGCLIVEAERRCAVLEVERDFWHQRDRENQARIAELEASLDKMCGHDAGDGDG